MHALMSILTFNIADAPFVEAVFELSASARRPVAVGLCGAQGSGKSTTASRVAARLRQRSLNVAVCSLDDFYLTRAQRLALAHRVHPLLATRGVPGTHDMALLMSSLDALFGATDNTETPLPIFDKASDDRLPEKYWSFHLGRPDIVLLEGWCIGARPQAEAALLLPVNDLERYEDADCRWRKFVNDRLNIDYSQLFERLDLILMLRAPSFGCVHDWRAEQERNLKSDSPKSQLAMDDAALAHFIAHYERLTRWLLQDEPADLIADLDKNRVPTGWRIGKERRR